MSSTVFKSAVQERNGRGAAAAVQTTSLADPEDSAKAARLRYIRDNVPGIRRCKRGKGFVYIAQDGKIIRAAEELRRIKALAIPPAWRDVWISSLPDGHLQATGFDARGRKQYRYHARWREVRDETKYHRMPEFARVLPAIRRRVARDLALPGLPRAKVLATVVKLLETSMIRVGNEEYRRENNSFGLATLRSRHVNVTGSKLRFEFRGKSGVHHAVDLSDRRLAKIIRRCQQLPGHELFQYVGETGERQAIDSADVNDYLKEIAGSEFSSKDFRTWAGTVLAAKALGQFNDMQGHAGRKKNLQQAIEFVAKKLGNTKAVCRKSYIHPAVLQACTDGTVLKFMHGPEEKRMITRKSALTADETAVVALLKSQAKHGKLNGQSDLTGQLKKSLRTAVSSSRKSRNAVITAAYGRKNQAVRRAS